MQPEYATTPLVLGVFRAFLINSGNQYNQLCNLYEGPKGPSPELTLPGPIFFPYSGVFCGHPQWWWYTDSW